ncbi:MAG TPA: hypothetical protein VLS51_11780 [Propionibacteriaceae bacterium]|nr:hypothetical protein [Propionibacteriaceae bacterium]
MSEHGVTPGRPDVSEDIPGGSAYTTGDDLDADMPGERLDDDFDVATAREQVWEESHRHPAADPSGSMEGAPDVVDGS